MADRDSLVVPPHDSIVFAPRALHVMAHGVPRTFAVGDSLGISIAVRNGSPLIIRAAVRE
jgi:copper(I)-binding protein